MKLQCLHQPLSQCSHECYLTSLLGHCLLSSLQILTHVWFLLSLGNIQVSPAEWRESTAQRQGRNDSTLHPFLDAKTSKASSCWEHAGEITPFVTLDLGQENSKHVTLPQITGNCVQWCWTQGRSTNLQARNCGIKAEGFDAWRKERMFRNITQTMQILYLKCP